MMTTRTLLAAVSLVLLGQAQLLANGGAWQTGVPLTGNGAASDQKKSTNVTIEDEKLLIDLHQEFAEVEVRYRMKNTGEQVDQDFFFPVERWAEGDGEDAGSAVTDLEGYAISADGSDLKFETVDAKGAQPKAIKDARFGDFKPGVRFWKKSSIPFTAGQTREIVIRYRSPYAAMQYAVSDDGHSDDLYFRYSLSPAATWKGPIGKGKITLTYSLPRPEEVVISKPKDRFKKISDTKFEWDFQNLKPTLADDIRIVVHPAYDSYWARGEADHDTEDPKFRAEYVVEKNRYFLQHTNYDAVASSTRKSEPAPTPSPTPASSPSGEEPSASAESQGEQNFAVDNIKELTSVGWVEGVEGDGIGENIALTVKKPLPLDAIMILPAYHDRHDPKEDTWSKYNRIAELEITLNGEQTFTVAVPDEQFVELYPIPVRGYTKPVSAIKLVIKKVHPGTGNHETCLARLELRAKLSQKPKIQGSR